MSGCWTMNRCVAPVTPLPWRTGIGLVLALHLGCSGGGASATESSDVGSTFADNGGSLDDLAVGTDVSTVEIAPTEDLVKADLGSDSGPAQSDAGCSGGGSAGCPCTENGECDTGFCVETADGHACAGLCNGNCLPGYACHAVTSTGGDVVNLCLPAQPRLCEPCGADSDCNNVLGGSDSRCVAYPATNGALIGQFCGTACDSKTPCPLGYSCDGRLSVAGVKANVCIRDDQVCPCDARAIAAELPTICSLANGIGKCSGKRACGSTGLSACDAPAAVTETCNLLDDDCDGQTDEPGNGLCDDGKPCTYDNCIAGQCQHPPASGPCDDGSACTQQEACEFDKCIGKTVDCSDGNPCTLDNCDPVKGCSNPLDNGAACSDGNSCTIGDACNGGLCLPGTATECLDNNPCTTDSCSAIAGCIFEANSLPCTDNDVCTTVDVCANAACKGGPTLPCQDGNACTTDACDASKGCVFVDIVGPCDDGNACSSGDTCAAGICKPGSALPCNDNNPCTDDGCDWQKGCTHSAGSGPCSDGDACTLNDVCSDGVCQSGQANDCLDANPCTTDSCDNLKGCLHTPSTQPCSDGNVCTVGDACNAGLCWPGKGAVCDDDNPCTNDLCDPLKGCLATANSLGCSDGSVCTVGDLCQGGQCQPGSNISCNDGNACTDDGCDAAKGCQHANNEAVCDDGSVCTILDSCAGGLCTAGGVKNCDDGAACTTDSCDPKAGCENAANTIACDDGNACTTGDACANTVCLPGKATSCDDANPCTDDSCDKATGCKHLANTANCNDSNACTSADICGGGSCQGGSAVACDDKNPCTTDSCNPALGCVYAANSAPCDDANPCTLGDACAAGGCKAGVAKNCDDANACTTDTCDSKTGACTYVNACTCTLPGTAITFGAAITVGYTNSGAIAAGDMNADSKLDYIQEHVATHIDLGIRTGAATFTNVTSLATPAALKRVAMGDVTGDGKADMVVTASNNVVGVSPSTGATFSAHTDYATGGTTPEGWFWSTLPAMENLILL